MSVGVVLGLRVRDLVYPQFIYYTIETYMHYELTTAATITTNTGTRA